MNDLIQKLHTNKYRIADTVTDRQFQAHPELEKQYGVRGKEKCREDALYHLNYLMEALKLESVELFTTYIAWMKGLLQFRNIPVRDLSRNLQYLREACSEELGEKQRGQIDTYIEEGIKTLDKEVEPLSHSCITADNPFESKAQTYLEWLLDGEKEKAASFIQNLLKEGVSIRDVYQHIFTSAQKEIGRLWYVNKISVGQEHFATAATRQIMGQFYSYIYNPDKIGRRLISSTVSSDLHEVGIQMITDYFEMEGWDTYYLGANMPAGDLIEAIKDQKADLLALSMTIPYHISEGKELIKAIRTDDEIATLPVIVGGYPFGIISDLWQKIGADGTARTAEDAISLAKRLIEN